MFTTASRHEVLKRSLIRLPQSNLILAEFLKSTSKVSFTSFSISAGSSLKYTSAFSVPISIVCVRSFPVTMCTVIVSLCRLRKLPCIYILTEFYLLHIIVLAALFRHSLNICNHVKYLACVGIHIDVYLRGCRFNVVCYVLHRYRL